MKRAEGNAIGTAWEGPGDRARHFMREHLDVLRGYAAVPDTSEKTATAPSPPARALAAADLPAEMQRLLERYQREHPETVVHPVAYMTVGVPDATGIGSEFADISSEQDLVILALTETVASTGQVEARSQVLLLRSGEKQ